MLTKEQLRIFGIFKKELFTSLTFRQVKEQSKQNSNNIVQIALKEFQSQKIVKTINIADITTYSLNLENNLTLSYLSLLNELELIKIKLPHELLQEIQNRVFKHTPFFTLIIFGGYAKNKANENSDLDIALIAESEQAKKEISPYLETIKRRELLKIDYHIFTKDEFLELLDADYENLGKQIYKNNLVYYGYTQYLNIIKVKKIER